MKITALKLLIGTIAALAMGSAAKATDFLYDHNGSRMRVNVQGNAVSIYYQEPRAGLRGVGVQPGTLLFNGKVSGGVLDGMSRIFNANCGEVDYYVHGEFSAGQDFKLTGAAPVLSNMSCRIVDNTYEGSNANLLFTSLSGSINPPPPARVASGCVKGVRTSLNVRVGPGPDYGRIGELPAGACNIRILPRCDGNWCAVRRGNIAGWVSMQYVQR